MAAPEQACGSATARRAALAPPPVRDENPSSGSRDLSPGRWHFTRRGSDPRIDLRSGGTVATIFAFADADLQVSVSDGLRRHLGAVRIFDAVGLTPVRLGAIEPVGQSGAGACGTVDCCHERESQTHTWEALPTVHPVPAIRSNPAPADNRAGPQGPANGRPVFACSAPHSYAPGFTSQPASFSGASRRASGPTGLRVGHIKQRVAARALRAAGKGLSSGT